MNSREQARIALETMNMELAGLQVALTGAQPIVEADANELFKKADAAATALNDSITTMTKKITTLVSDINGTDVNTPLSRDLTNRVTDLQTEWKGFFNSDQVKAFNLTYLEYHLVIIRLNLANLATFQLDVRESNEAKKLRDSLEERQEIIQEHLEKKGDEFTISDMTKLYSSAEASVTTMETFAKQNKNLESKYADEIGNINRYIPTLVSPDDALLTNLDRLAKATKDTTYSDVSKKLTDLHKQLQTLKTLCEQKKAALETAKNELSKDANSSKAKTLIELASIYSESDKIKQEIQTTTTAANLAIQDIEKRLEIDKSKPAIEEAITKISKYINILNKKSAGSAISDINFKREVEGFIKNALEAYRGRLQNPAETHNFKGKTAKELLNHDAIKKAHRLSTIMTNKEDISHFITKLNEQISATAAKPSTDDFTNQLKVILNTLERKSRELNDPHMDEDVSSNISKDLDFYNDNTKLITTGETAYIEGTTVLDEVKHAVNELNKTFVQKTAPAHIQKLFNDLTNKQKKLEGLLESIEDNLAAALTNRNDKNPNTRLKNAVEEINKDDGIQHESLELAKQAEEAIEAQKVKEAQDKIAKEIEPLLKALAEAIAAASKEIDSIQGLDTFKTKKEEHQYHLQTLKETLVDLKDRNKNPIATLKEEAEEAIEITKELKESAETTRKEEANKFQTAAARTRNEKVQKEANAKIKSIASLLEDYKTKADKIEKYDDTAKSNLTQIQQIIANYEKEYNKLHDQFIENPVVIPTDAKDTADATEFNKAIDAKQKILDDLVALEKNIKEHTIEVSDKDKFTFDQMFNALEEHVKNEKISDQHDSYKETADPNYKYKLDSEKKSFTVLDQSIPQHKAMLDRWESRISAAMTSAEVKRQLPEDQLDKILEKVRDLRRAFNFYIDYKNTHAKKGSYSLAEIIQLKEQIGRIEALATEAKTQQKYVLQGMGVIDIKYHANLADAEKEVGSIDASIVASGSISSFGLMKQHILISGEDALRREHKMQVTRQDGTTKDLTDTMITYPNAKNGTLTSNFYESKDNAVEIDGLPDVYKHKGLVGIFKSISRPADELLDQAFSRYTAHTADPRYKPGPMFINPGNTQPQMRPKQILAMALILKSKGVKIDPDCLPLLGKEMAQAITNINDEQIKFVVEYLEKRQLVIKNTTALEIEAASEKAFSRFKAR